MQHAPRRRLHPDFVRAVRLSGHSLTTLAGLAHFAACTQLSTLLSGRRPARATALTVARLQSLAAVVGYDAPIFTETAR